MQNQDFDQDSTGTYSEADHEHAVISTFNLFSIGIGSLSSYTVGSMRAGAIFVADLIETGLLYKVDRIIIYLYNNLALIGERYIISLTLLLSLKSIDIETVNTSYIPKRFNEIKAIKKLFLGHSLSGNIEKEVSFNYK